MAERPEGKQSDGELKAEGDHKGEDEEEELSADWDDDWDEYIKAHRKAPPPDSEIPHPVPVLSTESTRIPSHPPAKPQPARAPTSRSTLAGSSADGRADEDDADDWEAYLARQASQREDP